MFLIIVVVSTSPHNHNHGMSLFGVCLAAPFKLKLWASTDNNYLHHMFCFNRRLYLTSFPIAFINCYLGI